MALITSPEDYGLYIPSHIHTTPDQLTALRKRNKRLVAFFQHMVGSESCYITLIGTIHQPRVLIQDTYIIGTFCHNFELHFLGDNEESFGFINLTADISTGVEVDPQELRVKYGYLVRSAAKLPTFAFRDPSNGLFFFGYQPNRGFGKLIPLFTANHPRVYTSHSRALKKLQELKDLGYDLVMDGEPTELSLKWFK